MPSRSNPPAPPQAKIDWYSFTVPLAGPLEGNGVDVLEALNHALRPILHPAVDTLQGDGTWSVEPAKGFYAYRATHRASRLAVSWGPVNAHAFVEMAGQCCDWLRLCGALPAIIAATHTRVSRIDLAIDLSTSTRPVDFVAAGYAERFSTSVSDIRSETGETYYVGSRKSDRCARVYRYGGKHPRAHLLRLEAEYKGKAARELGKLLAERGEVEAVRAAHAVFEWKHTDLDDGFLQPALCAPVRPISPVMASSDGSTTVFDRRCFDITRRDLLTLFAGLRRKSYRRLVRDCERQYSLGL